MSFEGYLFDLDGTLLDTLPDLHNVVNEALSRRGFPPRTLDEVHSFIGNGALALVWSCVPEGTPQEEVDRVYHLFCSLYEEFGMDKTVPFAGILEALASLSAEGKKVGVVSNKFDGGVKAVQARYLPGLLDAALGESESIPRKPDPRGLLECARQMGVAPEKCVYFGDSASDMMAAHNAGMYAVGVTWGYPSLDSLKSGEPDCLIDEPGQILEVSSK